MWGTIRSSTPRAWPEPMLDAPVIKYWPEFGAAGKGGVLVRMLLDHTVGLPSFPEPVERQV